jgi:hypothetical protein
VDHKDKNSVTTEATTPKLLWVTPEIADYSPRLIQQQEDEALLRLLSDENAFKLLTGSTT